MRSEEDQGPQEGEIYGRGGTVQDLTKALRHGRPWTPAESQVLTEGFRAGVRALMLARELGRGVGAVLARLEGDGYLRVDPGQGYAYTLTAKGARAQREFKARSRITTQIINEEKETTMALAKPDQTPNIETKTLIAGVDAASMTDAQIFTKIAELESAAKALVGINAKSVKKDAAVKSIEEDIAKLVAYVDGR